MIMHFICFEIPEDGVAVIITIIHLGCGSQYQSSLINTKGKKNRC